METKTGNTRNLLDISWGGLGDQCDIEIKDKDQLIKGGSSFWSGGLSRNGAISTVW